MKNSRSTTPRFASLHHLRWNESLWGEERNRNRLAPSQGCTAEGREPQTSVSRGHHALREQCALLYCHATTKSVMMTAWLDTPPTIGSLLFQCTELNWQYSQLPNILSGTLLVSPRKVKIIFLADSTLFLIFADEEMKCPSIPWSVVVLQSQND
jgi:hypothetical protein